MFTFTSLYRTVDARMLDFDGNIFNNIRHSVKSPHTSSNVQVLLQPFLNLGFTAEGASKKDIHRTYYIVV